MIDLNLRMFGGGGSGSGLTYDNNGFSQKITSKNNIGGKGTYILFDTYGKPRQKSTGIELKERIKNKDLVYNAEIEEWVTKKDVTYTIKKYDKKKTKKKKK